MARKKYKPLHQIVKSLPQDFQQIADSAIDHVGTIVEHTDPLELLLGSYSAYFASKATLDPEKLFVSFLAGMCAARGLSSNSEILSTASLAYLIGIGFVGLGASEILEKRAITKSYLTKIDAATSDEEKAGLWKEWATSVNLRF